MKKFYAFLSVVLFVTMLFSSQKVTAQYSIPFKMNWWYESRLVMFIHFGSYSYLAQGEWAMAGGISKTDYQTKVSTNFKPTNFNAGTIAQLAQKAGMRLPAKLLRKPKRRITLNRITVITNINF